MTNDKLIHALYKIGCIQFGEFNLKSGITSSIYINLRKIISYPQILRTVAHSMWAKAADLEVDLICGVPYTALPIATCISLEHNIPMIMRRKEKKDYGTKQLIEGEFNSQQSCLVIEDVVTSGSSILETTSDLEQAGLKVRDVIALIDREQGGKATLTVKYSFQSILSLSNILNSLLHSNSLSEYEKNIVKKLLPNGDVGA